MIMMEMLYCNGCIHKQICEAIKKDPDYFSLLGLNMGCKFNKDINKDISEDESLENDTDIKMMDIKEFRELGLLVEVNRQFFHPIGLEMIVAIDEDNEDNEEFLWGIRDFRENPRGMLYEELEIDKVEKATEFIRKRHTIRKLNLGYVYQEE
jgi:hypothetical protein